jgi:hypothetical protein
VFYRFLHPLRFSFLRHLRVQANSRLKRSTRSTGSGGQRWICEAEQQFTQLSGQFLIDRSGIIRWANIECAREGPAGLGKFPSYEDRERRTDRGLHLNAEFMPVWCALSP